jgi:hypothetical protein
MYEKERESEKKEAVTLAIFHAIVDFDWYCGNISDCIYGLYIFD